MKKLNEFRAICPNCGRLTVSPTKEKCDFCCKVKLINIEGECYESTYSKSKNIFTFEIQGGTKK